MKAFVTGVTGFVGSHLAEHLLASGDEVLGTSRGGRWPHGTPPELIRRVPVLTWDLSSRGAAEVRALVGDFAPDVIYHLAAMSVPADCGADQPTVAAIMTNVEGTREVITLATSLPQRPRVVFASSCYVYGAVAEHCPWVTEDALCRPLHGYGITKLAAEEALRAAGAGRALDFVIARAFQHSGPRQSPRMMLPEWARQVVTGATTVRAICLDTYLDITDVRDVVQAYRALAVSGRSATVYNVGSGVNRRAGDLLQALLVNWPTPCSVLELSPGRRQHPIADRSRITADTGWEPTIPLTRTLSEILTYWKELEGNA